MPDDRTIQLIGDPHTPSELAEATRAARLRAEVLGIRVRLLDAKGRELGDWGRDERQVGGLQDDV
jgi:hypothetical protein